MRRRAVDVLERWCDPVRLLLLIAWLLPAVRNPSTAQQRCESKKQSKTGGNLKKSKSAPERLERVLEVVVLVNFLQARDVGHQRAQLGDDRAAAVRPREVAVRHLCVEHVAVLRRVLVCEFC